VTEKIVSDLMEPDGASWNEHMLAQNLLPIDAQAVLHIPLGRAREDIWAWEGECHGLYSVRSAYRFLVEKEAQERDFKTGGSAHLTGNNNPLWRKLWALKVPPKVRVFWWTFHMTICPLKLISTIDTLSSLQFVIAVEQMRKAPTMHWWSVLMPNYFRAKLREFTGIKLPKLRPRTWAVDLLDTSAGSEEARGIIMCGMWSLWNSRNDRRHGKAAIEPRRAIEWAVDVCFQLLSDEKQSTEAVVQKVEAWRLPPDGHIKSTRMVHSVRLTVREQCELSCAMLMAIS
jgi:hypothetical protein